MTDARDTATPKPRARPSWPVLLLIALAGAAFGGGSVWFVRHVLGVDLKPLGLGAPDLALVPLWFLVAVLAHELGHVLGGLLAGMRFLLLLVGPLKAWRSADGVRFGLNRNLATWGGLAACAPPDTADFRRRMQSLVAGGPLASLALALLALLLAYVLPGKAGFHAGVVAALSLVIAVVTLIPLHAGGFESDGAQWLELRRGGTGVEQRALVISLLGSTLAGVRPRDYDATLLERGLALAGAPRNVTALRLLAYAHALDRGDMETARLHAAAVAEGYEHYPDGFRQSLALELAWFEARHGTLDAARAWLARGKGGVVDTALRLRAEAAVELAAGDASKAASLAEQAIAELPRSMDPGGAVAARDWLETLRAEAQRLQVSPVRAA